MSAAKARQKLAQKRSLLGVNEHFKPIFNTEFASAIAKQHPVRGLWPMHCLKSPTQGKFVPALLAFSLCLSSPKTMPSGVTVYGIEGDIKNNVLLMLPLKKTKCDAAKWKIEHLFEDSDEAIDQALRAYGYYHASIKKALTFQKDCWQADYTINQGPRVSISSVNIRIKGDAEFDPEFQTLINKMPLQPGSPLHHGKYESMKGKIESLAMDKGFMQGEFTEKKLIVNKASNTAQIKLTYDSGKRLVLGDITIDQGVLDNVFVSKYLSIQPGDVYSSEQLAKTHNALAQSGYFEVVDINADLHAVKDNKVPVTIKLTARKPERFGIGVGYDTDIGPLLNFSYINRRVNRHGHFMTANLDLSPVLSTAEVEYTMPLENPMSDFLSFGSGFKHEDTKTYRSTTATVSAKHKHIYSHGWKQTLFLDWSYETFKTASTSGKTLLLVPGGNWLRSVSDNPIRPKRGHRIELEAKGSYENPISDVSFLQGYLSAIWLHELPYNGKFIGRTVLGATWVDDITRLPTTYRFYAGGINSIRGYAYKELGPKDKLGNVEGGAFLGVFSAEYEHPIYDNWGVAAFVDTGNAFNLDSIDINTGVGLGVRWYSPVGPIRIDFAVPIDQSDSKFQIHFAAGARI